jgi:hypothetical protein
MDSGFQPPGRKFGKSGGQLLNGMADTIGKVDQRNKGYEPHCSDEDDQCCREAAPKIALLSFLHELSGSPILTRELIHLDFAQVAGKH